jgi:hypothetical protein
LRRLIRWWPTLSAAADKKRASANAVEQRLRRKNRGMGGRKTTSDGSSPGVPHPVSHHTHQQGRVARPYVLARPHTKTDRYESRKSLPSKPCGFSRTVPLLGEGDLLVGFPLAPTQRAESRASFHIPKIGPGNIVVKYLSHRKATPGRAAHRFAIFLLKNAYG